MKKYIVVMLCLFGLLGCSDRSETSKSSTEKMPNKDTRYETIISNKIAVNEVLLNALQSKLAQDDFQIVEKEQGNQWSENDCQNNKIIQVKGNGIRSYRAKRNVAIENNNYPDFALLVFTFENEILAEKNFQTLKSAVDSDGGYCNGKSPEIIVRNGKEVFYFTTRDELFRSYINQYANFVADFKP